MRYYDKNYQDVIRVLEQSTEPLRTAQIAREIHLDYTVVTYCLARGIKSQRVSYEDGLFRIRK